LQIIRPCIDVAMIVGGDAAVAIECDGQIDAEPAVRKDGVTQYCVVNGGIATDNYAGIIYIAPAAIKGDDVTRTRDCAAHGRIMTANEDTLVITQGFCACDIRTDNIALNKRV